VKQEYRADIDGLRTVAVLAVVLYHAFPGRLPGGFVGVDIFFVISGYLISGIIFADLDSGRFSYLDFYRRRVRRIFPALIVVLVTTLAVGWFALLPDEFREVGLQAVAGAASVANVLFWYQSGYFDAASATKPLLHLWSLGVEEQFYLVWPWFLVAVRRGTSRGTYFAITAVIVASFGWNVLSIRGWPSAAFYLPMSRMWELGLGSLLAWQMRQAAGPPQSAPALAAAGLALIMASVALIKPTYSFPGWWAVLPCAGAACLIAARGSPLNRALLAHPVMVFVGRISYPLYLWHWVLLTLPQLATGAELSRTQRSAIVVASVVLAWLTYMIVEKRVRAQRFAFLRPAALAGFMGLTASAAALAYATDGAAGRYPAALRGLVDIQHDTEKERYRAVWRMGTCFLSDEQTFEDPASGCIEPEPHDQRLLVLWGDSHAASLYPGIKALQAGFPLRLAQFTKAECLPLLGAQSFPSCASSNDAVLERIKALHPDAVLMEGDWTSDLKDGEAAYRLHMEKLRSTVRALRDAGVRRVIVFGSLPRWTIYEPRVALRLWQQSGALPARSPKYVDGAAAASDARVAAAVADTGAVFVSPLALLCDEHGCLLSAAEHEAAPISWDKGHLTEAGSVLVVKLAMPRLF
jgi:peptidoglycan/LPS O-acetylase OafA/YrhL